MSVHFNFVLARFLDVLVIPESFPTFLPSFSPCVYFLGYITDDFGGMWLRASAESSATTIAILTMGFNSIFRGEWRANHFELNYCGVIWSRDFSMCCRALKTCL